MENLNKDNYSFKNNAYWHKETNDGPYCSRCFDMNVGFIHLNTMPENSYATCPECKNRVNITGKSFDGISVGVTQGGFDPSVRL